ncbi:hypothetical protein E4T56_gene1527 [Termitomyces sp. T112]|nr:hypothetical protein E4T56_gene1527 [Termitomyces sp. T112]
MPWSPCDSPQVPGCPDYPSLPTILIPCPLRCLTLLLTQIILDPPPPEDPLDGPQGPLLATQVNPPVEGHPTADPLGDGAQQWTTSPPPAWKWEQLLLLLQRRTPAPSSKSTGQYLRRTGPGGKQVSGLGLEDALDRGPDPNVFSTPATLLRATILALDSPPVHLPSHSSTNLLLRTTLLFTTNPIPTLVNSGATDNFINESLAVLAPHPL